MWFYDQQAVEDMPKDGSSLFFFLLFYMKAAEQALLLLHSIPVRFYTKAGRDQNTDCNNYLQASLSWLGSWWRGWRVAERSPRCTTDCWSGHRDSGIAISCVWTRPRRSCCCCLWFGPSLYINLVASSAKTRYNWISRRKSNQKVEDRGGGDPAQVTIRK